MHRGSGLPCASICAEAGGLAGWLFARGPCVFLRLYRGHHPGGNRPYTPERMAARRTRIRPEKKSDRLESFLSCRRTRHSRDRSIGVLASVSSATLSGTAGTAVSVEVHVS